MSSLLTYWNNPPLIRYREKQLASLFKGYRYVLRILAELHPGFLSILHAHTDNFCDAKRDPWKPVMYKAVSLKDESRQLYLIGAIHYRIIDESDAVSNIRTYHLTGSNDVRIASQVLSDDIRKLLEKSDAVALEMFMQSLSPSFKRKKRILEQKLEDKHRGVKQMDRYNALSRMRNQDTVIMTSLGLDIATEIYLLKSPIKKIALESEEVQLEALDNLQQSAGKSDIEDFLEMYDVFTQSNTVFVEKYMLHELKDEQTSQGMMQRNPPMVSMILENMERYATMTVMVGGAHLFGDYGIVNLLRQTGEFSITPLELDDPRDKEQEGDPLKRLLEREQHKAKEREELLAWEARYFPADSQGPRLSEID